MAVAMSEHAARECVRLRADGRCEVCGSAAALEWSHRKSRGQGGLWSASNGIAACRTCHAQMHANPEEARSKGWHCPGSMDDDVVEMTPAQLVTWLGPGTYRLLPWGGYEPIELERPWY